MKTRKLSKQSNLAVICDQIYQATNQFLESCQDKKFILCFTKRQSQEEKIASLLLDVIEKTTARMSFPQIGFFEENQLLNNINQCYKLLSMILSQNVSNKKKMDSNFFIFFFALQSGLKSVISLFCPHICNVDLRYLDEYIEQRDLGMDCFVDVPLLKSKTATNDLSIDLRKKWNMGIFSQSKLSKPESMKPINDSEFSMRM